LLAQTTGKVFYCADEPNALAYVDLPIALFAWFIGRGLRATDIELRDFSSAFSVTAQRKTRRGEAVLNVPANTTLGTRWRHRASDRARVVFEKIAKSLTKFQHARDGSKIKYAQPRFLLWVDDYGTTRPKSKLHSRPQDRSRKRVLTMFSTARYSRTKALRKEFGRRVRPSRSRRHH